MVTETPIEQINQAYDRARKAFDSGKTKCLKFRRQQLKGLHSMINENSKLLAECLSKDLAKPECESYLAEISFMLHETDTAIQLLDSWTKPRKPKKNSYLTLFDEIIVVPEPYGVNLLVGCWNYPVLLLLQPLIGAIAAGNCAILKPSELAEHCSDFMTTFVPRYLDQDCFPVVSGGVEPSKALLTKRFDYIFYTGSTNVGKIYYQEAAKFLTPITLELGGKSPVFVDDTLTDQYAVWRRIIWGKCLNTGQTCVAPDYVLCSKKVQQQLPELVNKIITEFYGKDVKNSPDFGRIINHHHFNRLKRLLDNTKGRIIYGGGHDHETKYFEPTVIVDVDQNDSLMSEEIFGPILPIITVESEDEAVDFIRKTGEKPLSLYLFSENEKVIQKFIDNTSSGSMCINDTILQLSVCELPFGGVGQSGIGRYHGRFSFETFSHEKAILIRNYNAVGEVLGACRYPPYRKDKMQIITSLVTPNRILPPHLWATTRYMLGELAGLIRKLFRL